VETTPNDFIVALAGHSTADAQAAADAARQAQAASTAQEEVSSRM